MSIPEWFHVGVWLHTSCNDTWWGPVTCVELDSHDRPIVAFKFDSAELNEFIDASDDAGESTEVQIRIPAGECEMIGVRVERFDGDDPEHRCVWLFTPGNGCNRCCKLFSVHEKRER